MTEKRALKLMQKVVERGMRYWGNREILGLDSYSAKGWYPDREREYYQKNKIRTQTVHRKYRETVGGIFARERSLSQQVAKRRGVL